MSKRILFPFLALLGLALVAYVFFGPGPKPENWPNEEKKPVTTPELPPTVAPPPKTETPKTEPLRLDLSLQLTRAMTVAPKLSDPARGTGRNSSLAGVISGPDGSPLGGVSLRFSAGLNQGFETQSDEVGHYQFPPLFPGLHQLQISSGLGRMMREVRLQPGSGESRDFRFGAPSVVTGKVIDRENKPIEAVRIQIDEQETWTGKDGAFYLPGMFAGDAVLYAQAENYVYYRQNITIVPDTTPPLQVVLSPGGSISGGAYPVGGTEPALLYLIPNFANYDRSFPVEKFCGIEVGSGNSFKITNIPIGQSFMLFAFHPRSTAKPPMKQVLLRSKNENIVPLDFRFVTTRLIQGTVQDASTGNPIAGAKVRLFDPNPYATTAQVLRITGPGMGSFVMPMLPTCRKEVDTNYAGSFELESGDNELMNGARILSIEKEGYDSFEKTFSGAQIPRQNISLYPPEALKNKATLELRFEPEQSVQVSMTLNGAAKDPISISSEEKFRVTDLVPGVYRLEIRHKDRSLFKNESLELGGTRLISVFVAK